jgi:hypothetical protein
MTSVANKMRAPLTAAFISFCTALSFIAVLLYSNRYAAWALPLIAIAFVFGAVTARRACSTVNPMERAIAATLLVFCVIGVAACILVALAVAFVVSGFE